MSQRSRLAAALLLASACAVILIGCGDGSTTSDKDGSPASGRVSGGTVSVGATIGVSSLDPYKFRLTMEATLFPLLWSSLVQYGPEDGPELQPGLASSWSSSDDARVHTFELRPATFSNGDPLTAKDVVASIRRATNPKTAYAYRSRIPALASVEAVGKSTVEVTTEKASPLGLLSALTVVPIVAASGKTEGAGKYPITSGPFKVEDFEPDDHVTVVPNGNYWGEAPPADKIEIVRTADSAAAVTALRSGDLDVLWEVPRGDIEALRGEGIEIVLSEFPSSEALILVDTTSPPFDNPTARLALVHATDKVKMNQVAYAETLEVSPKNVPFPHNDPLIDSDLPDIPFDLARAKELFAEAGVEEGSTLTYWNLSGYGDWLIAGQILQADLKKIGINLRIETKEAAEYVERITPLGTKWPNTVSPNFYGVASPAFMNLWTPGTCVCNYDNPEYNRVVNDANTEIDATRREELYHEAQRIFNEEVPSVIIGQGSTPVAQTAEVDGVWVDPGSQTHFEGVAKVSE